MENSAVYVVRVRDAFCGVRGKFEEECVTTHKGESDYWFKQWKTEYDKESGFSVTRKVYVDGLPANFQYSL